MFPLWISPAGVGTTGAKAETRSAGSGVGVTPAGAPCVAARAAKRSAISAIALLHRSAQQLAPGAQDLGHLVLLRPIRVLRVAVGGVEQVHIIALAVGPQPAQAGGVGLRVVF